MRRIKEVLRLKQVSGLRDSGISRSARIARSTVKQYLNRAAQAGLNWAVAEGLSEEEVERRLFATTHVGGADRPVPDWEVVEQELRGRGVTLRLLWLEYLSRHPEGWRYTQFCEHFHAWQQRSRPPQMRQLHRAGAALEVDWAGMTLPVVDAGMAREAQVFVACLPCSDLIYAEATWTQGQEDWLAAHVRAFAYIGGCPETLVPDNTKTGGERGQLLGSGAEPQRSRTRPPLRGGDRAGPGTQAARQGDGGECGPTGRDVGAGAAAPSPAVLAGRSQCGPRREG